MKLIQFVVILPRIFFLFSFLSLASFASRDLEDEKDELNIVEHIMQMPTEEKYQKLFQYDDELDDMEKLKILESCVQERHPVAQLYAIEIDLTKHTTTRWLFQTREISEYADCRKRILSSRKKIVESIQFYYKKLDQKIVQDYKKRGREALITFFQYPSVYSKYLEEISEFSGLAGLRPYMAFARKFSLTASKFKELFIYWNQQFVQSKTLTKCYENPHEIISFEEYYPTTRFWLNIIYRTGISDPFFPLTVNLFLIALDKIRVQVFEDSVLPWWKDPAWVSVTEC